MRLRRRRIRALVLLTVVVLFSALLATCLTGGSAPSTGSPARSPASTASAPRGPAVQAATSALVPWKLANPISRAVLLPGTGTELVIVGGLSAAGVSAHGVYTLDTTDGALSLVGNLTAGLHDSSGAVIGGSDYLFGGGAPATVATVQSLPAPGAVAGSLAAAVVVGSLPQPRSDSTAATVGSTTYIAGGYDGANPDPDVLATTDGRTFTAVATLPVPVRYPAVAAAGDVLYVFGGEAVTGAGAGAPVDVIQAVDLRRHSAKVVGHLPLPLEAAAAVTLGAQIYLAGGDTSSPVPSISASITATAPSGVAGGGESSPGTSSVATIWAFDAATLALVNAGQLQVPVSHSSVAVLGSTAWLVGGESDGTSQSLVQTITPDAAPGTGRGTSSSP